MMFGWLITIFIRCDLNFLHVHNGFKPKGIYNEKGKCNISFGFKWHLYLHGIWGVQSIQHLNLRLSIQAKVRLRQLIKNEANFFHIFYLKSSTELKNIGHILENKILQRSKLSKHDRNKSCFNWQIFLEKFKCVIFDSLCNDFHSI